MQAKAQVTAAARAGDLFGGGGQGADEPVWLLSGVDPADQVLTAVGQHRRQFRRRDFVLPGGEDGVGQAAGRFIGHRRESVPATR
ncbi:hypothetical protein SDC9_189776 [bioreactor metagenome]|uniref:Uncharacterized protein n=1 Tax=bioreactor metagenome TaxID=1076179 RepID=A0A645HTN7_9ZZZZ